MAEADRGERILDAAADLVLRWGYKRVTIEEVAKRAGIGKGTVYLHFRTRTWLFVCVLMRESLDLVDELVAAIHRDAATVQIAEQVRLTYLEVQRRPLLRAMFTRDHEVLGDLARDPDADPVREWRAALAVDLFRLLRDHGLMRSDLGLTAQMYLVGAVQTGFYLQHPAPGSPEDVAAVLHHTVHAALEPPTDPDPAALAAVVPAVLERYRRFRATVADAIAAQAPQGGPA
jgi:AcrR family transcriptional regulator